VFEVLVYFKGDSVVYNSIPDQLLYHETQRRSDIACSHT